jgi:hypothetical protein
VRAWASLAALLVAVAALAAWIHFKPERSGAETYALSALKPGDVRRVRLERAVASREGSANEVVALEKSAGEWRMAQPTRARAEGFAVERALAILEARSAVRYAPTDLARFGLDRPQAVLTLEDQAFTYGAINGTTREQYVMTAGHVYLVPLAFTASLPRNADALLARRLLAPDEAPVRFDLPGFTVALEDGTWAVAPALSDVGADERNAWVDDWRQAQAIAAERAGAIPGEHIAIRLKDGRTIQLAIARREPEVVLVRKDEGVAYRFVADVGRKLLAPPGPVGGERVNK